MNSKMIEKCQVIVMYLIKTFKRLYNRANTLNNTKEKDSYILFILYDNI